MSLENILILAVLIVLAIVLIRFLTKILVKLVVFAVVAALIVYVLFYWNGGLINIGKDTFILYDLEEKYCQEKMDTVKCECIIQPLIEDIESKYSTEELDEIKKDRGKSVEILMNSIRENQESIKECLQENKSGNAWEEFLEDLKSSWLNRKLKELWEKGEEEIKEIA
jgi:hypothetical protein